MDSSNPTPTVSQPVEAVTGPGIIPPPQEGNKKLILIVVAVVLVLSIAIVSVMLISKKGADQKAEKARQTLEQLSSLATQLEAELSSIDLGSVEADLMEVDKDLESL